MPSLADALEQPDPSARLQAAMDAGSRPDASFVPTLVQRCAVEPDFNVREMLTWALVRNSADSAELLDLLTAELTSEVPQARSQALHTLSKIGDRSVWPAITSALLFDSDDTVARTAWRAAVILAPEDEAPALAGTLASLLGRGDREMKSSLSRALASLTPASDAVLDDAAEHGEVDARIHALATLRLIDDPEEGFDSAWFEAQRGFDTQPPAASQPPVR